MKATTSVNTIYKLSMSNVRCFLYYFETTKIKPGEAHSVSLYYSASFINIVEYAAPESKAKSLLCKKDLLQYYHRRVHIISIFKLLNLILGKDTLPSSLSNPICSLQLLSKYRAKITVELYTLDRNKETLGPSF